MPNSKGFTLIEMLIVVVVIGILAAIAIPRYASTKEKAFDAAAKGDLRNLMVAQEAYYADYQTYAGLVVVPAGGSITTPIAFQASTGVSVGALANATGFLMTAKHASSGTTWCINSFQIANGKSRIVKLADCF